MIVVPSTAPSSYAVSETALAAPAFSGGALARMSSFDTVSAAPMPTPSETNARIRSGSAPVLVLTAPTPSLASAEFEPFLRKLPADDANIRSFEALLATGKPRCGQVRDTQRDFLFGPESASIGSVALVPTVMQLEKFPEYAEAAAGKFPDYTATMIDLHRRRRDTVMAAFEAGVAIYAGSDGGGVARHGNLAGEVLALAGEHVDVTGTVDDVRPHLWEAAA